MASTMLERDDISVYVIAGVPKSFKKRLSKFVEGESRAEGEIMLLDHEITEWLVARLRGEKARSHEETATSAALWRAFRALSAARYHVQEDPELEGRIRALRSSVEELWALTRPGSPEEVVDAEEEAGEGEEGSPDSTEEGEED
jgi:hypothetical protein